MRSDKYEKIIEMLKAEYKMPENYAREYLNNLNYYVHGIASYVAVGYADVSKQAIMEKVQYVSDALLKNWQEMQGE